MMAHKSGNKNTRKKTKKKLKFQSTTYYLVVELNKMCLCIDKDYLTDSSLTTSFFSLATTRTNDIHVVFFCLRYLQPRGIIAPKCDHSLQQDSRTEPLWAVMNVNKVALSLSTFNSFFFTIFVQLFCIFVPGTDS